jgi:hypothetical protein
VWPQSPKIFGIFQRLFNSKVQLATDEAETFKLFSNKTFFPTMTIFKATDGV